MSAYVKENERGTPILYFPDPNQHDGVGCREATVAEWSFWRKYNEALEALRFYADNNFDDGGERARAALAEAT